MKSYTPEEQIICYIARSFGPEDNYAVLATSVTGLIALVLARELYAPRLSVINLAGGKYAFTRDVRFPHIHDRLPRECIETLFDTEDVFEMVTGGKYFIIMQPLQIDKQGHTNLSLLGDKCRPARCFVGSRNAPSNTVNMPRTLYFVPQHSKRVYVDKVDFISGVGYGEERKQSPMKWGLPIEVISDLCVIDFEENTGRARLKSVHTGVSVEKIRENTGFDLIMAEGMPETAPPAENELQLLRETIDPLGMRRLDFLRGEEHKRLVAELMAKVPVTQ
jgi:acyl CoA:acetate/3-ketoacid CoA transferase beta subunit